MIFGSEIHSMSNIKIRYFDVDDSVILKFDYISKEILGYVRATTLQFDMNGYEIQFYTSPIDTRILNCSKVDESTKRIEITLQKEVDFIYDINYKTNSELLPLFLRKLPDKPP